MADLLDFAPVRVLTSNAQPGAGYIARFYQSGTTTPVTVFTDASLGTPWGTSITADAEGKFAAVFSAGGAIKATIETPAGAIVATVDPVQSVPSGSAAASAISFAPTVALPFSNVQAAIEGAAASAASGFSPFGLGVTGSVALIADLNATNIATGQYRFDATTTGTYPTGVAAADTGAVMLVRETAGSAWMWLYHDTTDRVFIRRMTSSTWGAWRENITADIGAAQGDILFRSATAWTRLAAGTSGQVLRTNGVGANPSWGSAPGITLGAPQNTTSGSNIDFTGIPAGVNRVTLMLNGVSYSTASTQIRIQIGDSGGVETTGYVSICGYVANVTGQLLSTSGFDGQFSQAVADTLSGAIVFTRQTGNTWAVQGALGINSAPAGTMTFAGTKTLSAELDRVRITSVAGTAVFDAGSANVMWE